MAWTADKVGGCFGAASVLAGGGNAGCMGIMTAPMAGAAAIAFMAGAFMAAALTG